MKEWFTYRHSLGTMFVLVEDILANDLVYLPLSLGRLGLSEVPKNVNLSLDLREMC